MSGKTLYIIDIRSKQKDTNISKYIDTKNAEILSLTPYSNFLLDGAHLHYNTFHTIILPLEEFQQTVLNKYSDLEKKFQNYNKYSFLLRDFAFILTHEVFIGTLFHYIEEQKKLKYKIIYLTDGGKSKSTDFSLYRKRDLFQCPNLDEVRIINGKDSKFYTSKKRYFKVINFFYKTDRINKLVDRYIVKQKERMILSYDNSNFRNFFKKLKPVRLKQDYELSKKDIAELNSVLMRRNLLCENKDLDFFCKYYKSILDDFQQVVNISNENQEEKIHPFVFLSDKKNYLDVLRYRYNSIPTIFMQHGSYLHENMFLKYNEIYPADINFVFNDFTNDLFQRRGAKQVHTVGSIDFNYPIIEKKKKYDFTYIIYCTSYNSTAVYLSDKLSLLSVDAENIYNRHKKIIELFGMKFKDKKLCIKIQPGIFTDAMLYIPFLELSNKFENIIIEFAMPLKEIIEQSKYIISDYFSSEFINRELHYKRDIILFKGAPLSLPEGTLEDMQKMFLLVDTVEDLENTIKNIKALTKNRKRYDDIIEYYSSKKCNTKEEVTKILEKEMYGR